MNICSSRGLSLYGKVTIIKALVIPKIFNNKIFAIKCYKTWHDVSTFPERHCQVRVNYEIEYIYSENMNKLKEALKVKQRAWP